MGPERDEQQEYKPKPLAKVQVLAKKTIEKYFHDPLHYLYYSMLTITIVGLFFNRSFSWQYYFFLGVVSGIKIYHYATGSPNAK